MKMPQSSLMSIYYWTLSQLLPIVWKNEMLSVVKRGLMPRIRWFMGKLRSRKKVKLQRTFHFVKDVFRNIFEDMLGFKSLLEVILSGCCTSQLHKKWEGLVDFVWKFPTFLWILFSSPFSQFYKQRKAASAKHHQIGDWLPFISWIESFKPSTGEANGMPTK